MDNNTAFYIMLAIAAGMLIFSLFTIIKALKTGKISYSGNRSYMPTMTYTRKDSPFGFWAGILVFSFIGFVAIAFASITILSYVFGINI